MVDSTMTHPPLAKRTRLTTWVKVDNGTLLDIDKHFDNIGKLTEYLLKEDNPFTIVKHSDAVTEFYGGVPQDTTPDNPLHIITTVGLWIKVDDGVFASINMHPMDTISEAVLKVLSTTVIDFSKAVMLHKGCVLSNYEMKCHELMTTQEDYLLVRTQLGVKTVLNYSTYTKTVTINVYAKSTVQHFLTNVKNKLPKIPGGLDISSTNLVIEHNASVVANYYLPMIEFDLDKPFHIKYEHDSEKSKIRLLADTMHPPSTYAMVSKCKEREKFAAFTQNPICYHRPAHGNHVSIYYPGFHNFVQLCENVDLNKEDCELAMELCLAMAKTYETKDQRIIAFKEVMELYLKNLRLSMVMKTGGAFQCDLVINSKSYLEFKNEVGTGNCDSFREALAYYCHDLQQKLLLSCPAPSFIIEVFGPHMIISGAVYGQKVYVDRLVAPLWLVPQPNDNLAMYNIARTVKALSISMRRLEEYYASLSLSGTPTSGSPDDQSRFPAFTSSGEKPNVRYTKEIKTHVFRAKWIVDASEHNVIVKFAQSYCSEAHSILASANFAPELLYTGSVGRFIVVVMKDLGDPAVYLKDYLANHPDEKQGLLDEFRQAVSTLHSSDFVHGDLRSSNVLLAENKVQIIDFDWAEKIGRARYPLYLNHVDVCWPEGVSDGLPITKEHDMYWIQELAR